MNEDQEISAAAALAVSNLKSAGSNTFKVYLPWIEHYIRTGVWVGPGNDRL